MAGAIKAFRIQTYGQNLMCGRFTATFEFGEIKLHRNIERDLEISPALQHRASQKMPVIIFSGAVNSENGAVDRRKTQ